MLFSACSSAVGKKDRKKTDKDLCFRSWCVGQNKQSRLNMFFDSSVASGTCPSWNCEWHAASWYVLHFTLICSCDDGQRAHTHVSVSTGRDVSGKGHTRHKWSMVPEEYVTVGSFIHVVSTLSWLFSFLAKKKKKGQLPCCILASVHIPLLCYTLFLNSLSYITQRMISDSHQQIPWCEFIF